MITRTDEETIRRLREKGHALQQQAEDSQDNTLVDTAAMLGDRHAADGPGRDLDGCGRSGVRDRAGSGVDDDRRIPGRGSGSDSNGSGDGGGDGAALTDGDCCGR
jgi:hypothetical protein